ncbi:MAG: hypothetical protein AAF567_16800 [Actinomycetota bacterium]
MADTNLQIIGSAIGPNSSEIGVRREVNQLVQSVSRLVAGMRPSIFAIVGSGSFGADHLGREGQAVWRVHTNRLLVDAESLARQPAVGGEDLRRLTRLTNWLREERRLEAFRWTDGANLLRHMHLVFCGLPAHQHDLDGLVDVWRINLQDLASDVWEGSVRLGRGAESELESLVHKTPVVSDERDLRAILHDLKPHVDETRLAGKPLPLVCPDTFDTLHELLSAVAPFASGPRMRRSELSMAASGE